MLGTISNSSDIWLVVSGTRAGDSWERDSTGDRQLWANDGGGVRSVCKQRDCRASSAQTQGKDRTQVGEITTPTNFIFYLSSSTICISM